MSRLYLPFLSIVAFLFIATEGKAIDQAEINQAIERGVAALKRGQLRDGSWNFNRSGATSLAALTLLECGAKPDEKCIQSAADFVRQDAPAMTFTYSIAMAIVFLDRLGDPLDVPLIDSLIVRLLAGQTLEGAWGYECPSIGEPELNRLRTHIKNRAELRGGRELPRPGKRTIGELPKEIRDQLVQIAKIEPARSGGDNSNTQFAAFALWVGRRHGLPVDDALARLEQRFRFVQMPDGCWDYQSPMPEKGSTQRQGFGSPSMTAAGALGLTIAHGAAHDPEMRKARAPIDPTRDLSLQKALLALGNSIGTPVGKVVRPGPGSPIPKIDSTSGNGGAYYFLWSLERLAVALNLETIGKKDWYTWGAEVILANQGEDGTWSGDYTASSSDTCFCLMFLRRANLLNDISSNLRGRLKDPATVVLRSGGVGGAGLLGVGKSLKPALGPQGKPEDNRPKDTPKPKPIPDRVELTEADELGNKLVEAKAANQEAVLKELKEGKGGKYTDALSLAIPRLQGEIREKARDTLAERLTRMSAKTLGEYMKDADPEIRRGALMATYMKDLREHIPLLIERLDDKDAGVARAAQAALKEMTKQDFGPEPGSTREEHEKAISAWKEWWTKREKR